MTSSIGQPNDSSYVKGKRHSHEIDVKNKENNPVLIKGRVYVKLEDKDPESPSRKNKTGDFATDIQERFETIMQRSTERGKFEKVKILKENKLQFCEAIAEVLLKGNGKSVLVGKDHFVVFPSKQASNGVEVKVVKWVKEKKISEGSYGIITELGKKMVVKEAKHEKGLKEIVAELTNIKYLMERNGGKMPQGLASAYLFTGPDGKQGMLMGKKKGSIDHYPQEKLTREVFTRGFYHVFTGLCFLHQHLDEQGNKQSIPHGDIKSANILFDDQNFYLTDFGTTKRYSERRNNKEGAYTGTQCIVPLKEGIALAKLFQASNPLVNQRGEQLDIFQCGLAMYALLLGKEELPYKSGPFSIVQIEKGFTKEGEQGFSVIKEKFGQEIEEFIRKMLSPIPDDRPTAEQCRDFMKKQSEV